MSTLDSLLPVGDAISQLLYPYAEVVVHCIRENKIHAIFNPFSRRRIGDDSLLSREELSALTECTGPYEKTNWDGRRLKSISSVIRSDTQEAIGLLCINFDVSGLVGLSDQLLDFIFPKHAVNQPEPLFKDDWQERINVFIHQYLQKEQLSIDVLSRQDKKLLVEHLRHVGAFSGKNAAQYIANILGISRATVYKYIQVSDHE